MEWYHTHGAANGRAIIGGCQFLAYVGLIGGKYHWAAKSGDQLSKGVESTMTQAKAAAEAAVVRLRGGEKGEVGSCRE